MRMGARLRETRACRKLEQGSEVAATETRKVVTRDGLDGAVANLHRPPRVGQARVHDARQDPPPPQAELQLIIHIGRAQYKLWDTNFGTRCPPSTPSTLTQAYTPPLNSRP